MLDDLHHMLYEVEHEDFINRFMLREELDDDDARLRRSSACACSEKLTRAA